MTLSEAILAIVHRGNGNGDIKTLRLATIVAGSVIDGLCTVTPFDDGSTLPNVRIQANPDNGILPIPTDNSIVIIGEIAPFDYCILMYSSIQSIKLLDGSYNGLVKADELKTQLDKTNKVLTDVVNSLKNWTVTPSDGGAALKAYFLTQLGTDVIGDFSAIRNDNITHGNP